jgi:hypothetical protein
VPWAGAAQLQAMAYLLPRTALAGLEVALLDEGILLIAPDDQLPPLGALFEECAPSVFVPAGYELLPRISEEILARHLGGTDKRRFLFIAPGTPPLAIDREAFKPLARQLLAMIDLDPRAHVPGRAETVATTAPTVANVPLGEFPLWGFRDS